MKYKKISALLAAAALMLSVAGCHEDIPSSKDPIKPIVPAEGSYSVDYRAGTVTAGAWKLNLRTDTDASVRYNDVYAGGNGKDYTDAAFYTYRESISSTGGMNWSPHNWQTTSDGHILEYTTTGFYRFAPNSDLSGWTIVDEMAQGAPRDVTSEYVGSFGITAGESARAWKIDLNPNACWANGTAINADTYLYSYKELLNGKMMNRRADSLYSGNFAIVGAKEYLYGKTTWNNVGILKTGEYSLVFITASPVADPDFYVPYYLSDTYLVYKPLWESCKTYFDANGNIVSADSADIASITTNYSTSSETSMSYGPYSLTYFEQDKQITLERNELWYGYADGKHFGQYQADRISCQVISDSATALLAFLKGDLDSVDLSAADMEKYAASDRLRYIPQTYTTKLTFNTDEKALAARGTQILANANFRRAFSLAIDRTTFAASYTSAGAPGYGILNDRYVYDPYTGESYRDSAPAKNALVQLYGLTYGEDGDYATLDEAYAAVTGYDTALARRYMQLAYDEAVAAGSYDGSSPIVLQLSVYQNEDVYTQMYHALSDALTAACAGTDFEGKVSLTMTVDADYYATMESGLTDIIFSTWGGSAYDPYSLLYNCYCDGGMTEYPNQMEYGFDAAAVRVTLNLDGKDATASLQDWARWCAGEIDTISFGNYGLGPFRELDAYSRCAIYADLEFAYLSQMVAVPLYYRTGATLLSQKGDYPIRQYMDMVEFGGIAFYAFGYSDSEWETVKGAMQY